MIAYVTGKVQESWDKTCILLTPGGIGYRLSLPAHTFNLLPEKGAEAAFYTSLAVREDAMELFGFATLEERQTFEILRGISKIGSRTALAILSLYRPSELMSLVQQDNIAALAKVPGIGQKTAQHLCLELKYRLKLLGKAQIAASAPVSPVFADTIAALANLGYDSQECEKTVADILKNEPDLDVTGAIRLALKDLSRSKG